MDRRVLATAIAMAVIGSGLTACGNDPEASPSPATSISTATTPTPTTETPSATPTPSEDPLFTEAKAVHLKYLEQVVALEKAGGAETLPDSMRVLVGGPFSKELQDMYAEFHRQGIRMSGSSAWKLASVWKTPAVAGNSVGLGACVDFRAVRYTKTGTTEVSKGTWRRDDLQLSKKGSNLIIVSGSSKQVDRCAR